MVESLRHDASLADICFVDAQTGWAAGDRGVVWHTHDGGATWERQTSGVDSRLSSLSFVDAKRGWAVGGDLEPFTGTSRGVVLRTEDGGATWKTLTIGTLPKLNFVRFFDSQRGVAVGEAAAAKSSGVYATNDGGATWQPLPAEEGGGWFTGDFLEPGAGAVAGASGRFSQLVRSKLMNPSAGLPSRRSFRAMRLVGPNGGWLVGDGGLVLTTSDLGRTWQVPPGELPEYVSEDFDFHAVAVKGANVWIAGSPGTIVLYSPDSGRSWHPQATGQFVPLRGIEFIDKQQGWAVGDLGNILATKDGGRTWIAQRSGGQRAALLTLVATPEEAPVEVIADAGAAKGYIAAVEMLHCSPVVVSGLIGNDLTSNERDAAMCAGAAAANTAWRFALPSGDLQHSAAELLAELNRETDGRALEQVERHVVRTIRMWRPEVIVTGCNETDCSDPRSAILASMIEQGVRAAADSNRFPSLADHEGLPPWQVKKVYACLPEGQEGDYSISTNDFVPQLGTGLANFTSPCRALLEVPGAPQRVTAKLLINETSNAKFGRDLFEGIVLANDSGATRRGPEIPVDDLERLKLLAQRRQHLGMLLKRTEGNAAWIAQVNQLLDQLGENDGAELLNQLAEGYFSAGNLDLAADTHFLLTRRYAAHPLSTKSLEWLVQFYSSTEMGHCIHLQSGVSLRQARFDRGAGGAAGTDGLGDVQQASMAVPAQTPVAGALSRDDRLRRATQLAEYLRSSHPELHERPQIRFAEVTALRQLGLANPAKRYFIGLRQLPENDPWRKCAETESWLATPAELPPPKALGSCRQAAERPRLDGDLSELMWLSTDRLRLNGKEKREKDAGSGEIRFAYDKEFLYLAYRCKAIDETMPNPQESRSRDADLSPHDRVRIRLDVDRDFTTAYELSFDVRGWTHDSCWGNSHWNPNWYVAAARHDTDWVVEAAIPLSQLVEQAPQAKQVWAVSVRRTMPRVGHQSWPQVEGEEDSPEQYGFLIFE